ncbi:GrpB family protein [Rubrobacter tropicus]|uniref:GrpB family protein n=1 Tax=Rubrobacter tropicus TaxID=2653851 RepID=A0A6G8QD03_9ACTN|nr:GrpB family protein [Rubrobacter tropicus]QIN84137.1 GrpB family protein [Rubrobacter tropicus]
MIHRKVKVVFHDPAWGEAFEAEAAALRSVLGDEALAIHHIGSTSVPGLAAKPTIDVLVEVRKIGSVDDFDGAMIEKGYEAWGEYGIPGRRFFTKNRGPARTHNVHVFEAGTPEVERHLAFRDYLREHTQTALAYGNLKKDLAEKFPADMESYMVGKDAFIKLTESEALSWNRAPKGTS